MSRIDVLTYSEIIIYLISVTYSLLLVLHYTLSVTLLSVTCYLLLYICCFNLLLAILCFLIEICHYSQKKTVFFGSCCTSRNVSLFYLKTVLSLSSTDCALQMKNTWQHSVLLILTWDPDNLLCIWNFQNAHQFCERFKSASV